MNYGAQMGEAAEAALAQKSLLKSLQVVGNQQNLFLVVTRRNRPYGI
jgi:hypothetical protein